MSALIHSWENPTSSKRNAIVFAHRNQAYGAYVIREQYEKSLVKAFMFTCSVFVLLLLIPAISKLFTVTEKLIVPVNDVVIDLTDQQFLKPEVLPQLPKQQVAALSSTFRFAVPKVTDDLIDENPPVQNNNNDLTPGLVDNTSDTGSVEDVLPPDGANDIPDIPVELPNVQEVPMFPGGLSAMSNFLLSNMRYPSMARESNIHGTVYISFVVDKEGFIKDANVIKGIGGGCDKEALRVVNRMPAWTAGKQNGRAVMVRMILPVQFSLR